MAQRRQAAVQCIAVPLVDSKQLISRLHVCCALHASALSLQATLQRSHAAQLAAVAQSAAPPVTRSSRSEEEDADAADDDDDAEMADALVPASARTGRGVRAPPLSALAVPPLLSPEVPALLSSLHGQLVSLRALLASLSPSDRAGCFDAVFAGPLFTVLVGHPKAAERGRAPQTPGSEGRLAAHSFPMLPHQDRVWEETLKCVECLLQAGIQAPVSQLHAHTDGGFQCSQPANQPRIRRLAHAAALSLSLPPLPQLPFRVGTFPKRFFLLFQQLLHFLPSDFKTSSSQPTGPAAAAATRSAAAASSTAATAATSGDGSRIAVWHSEETRIEAMTCVQSLFLCVEQQLQAGGQSPELSPLLHTLQRDPSFCISLGYYIHLMLRFATKERNRTLRTLAIDSLSTVVRLLQLPALNQPAGSLSPATAPSVPGRMLLLSYFPGIMSALFNLLIFDSGSAPARSGGWRLQLRAFELFVAVTRAAVQHVATVDEIVRDATEAQRSAATDDDELVARDANTIAADEALAKLRALVPLPTGAGASTASRPSSGPVPSASSLHPLLASILKPVDLFWWRESRTHIGSVMQRVFSSASLCGHSATALSMLTAAGAFLLGDGEGDAAAAVCLGPALAAQGHSLYTALLPPPCAVGWLEFVAMAGQHSDPAVRAAAKGTVDKIAQRVGRSGGGPQRHGQSALMAAGQTFTGAAPSSGWLSAGGSPPPLAAGGLVPLLRGALSSRLLRLPRSLPAAPESAQMAQLRAVKGIIEMLGQVADGSEIGAAAAGLVGSGMGSGLAGAPSSPLWDFISSDWDRILEIFYAVWAVDAAESRVLERAEGDAEGAETVTGAAVGGAAGAGGGAAAADSAGTAGGGGSEAVQLRNTSTTISAAASTAATAATSAATAPSALSLLLLRLFHPSPLLLLHPHAPARPLGPLPVALAAALAGPAALRPIRPGGRSAARAAAARLCGGCGGRLFPVQSAQGDAAHHEFVRARAGRRGGGGSGRGPEFGRRADRRRRAARRAAAGRISQRRAVEPAAAEQQQRQQQPDARAARRRAAGSLAGGPAEQFVCSLTLL